MGDTKLIIERPLHLMLAFAAAAFIIFGIKSEPSAARPLASSTLDSYHAAALDNSPLFAQLMQRRPAASDAQPQSTVTFSNPHLLVTTPKVDRLPPATNVETLKIRTELRTHRAVVFAAPAVRFKADLRSGARRIVRAGVPAVSVVTERVTLWNDVVVDRQVVGRVSIQKARPATVVAAPPRNVAEAMALTGSHKLIAVLRMIATAYTAGSARAVPTGRTASGLPAQYGVVAVDPHVIPLGTKLYIEGYGAAIAADTGGAIIGNRIDLCMDSLQGAISWGRQPVKVYVLRNR